MSEAPRPLPKGYELVRVIGAGGCGEVVLARQTTLGRLVAVKRIHGYALAADDNALNRFHREAKVLASIVHPGVVRVFEFQRTPQDALLIMEYVEGESLADRLDRGQLPVSEAITVLRDVADALRAAGARGIAHRDIKPGNVFLLHSGHAKVGDFGLARIASDPAVFRTTTGEVSGTPAYFPPECGSADCEPDERSDAYSFAVMAYEMLVGRLPFEGAGMMEIIAAHYTQQPPPPEGLVPGFPAIAAEALLAGLAKTPAQRPLPWQLVDRLEAVPAAAWPPVAAPSERAPIPRSAPTIRAVAAPPSLPARGTGRGRQPTSKRWAPSRRVAAAAVLLLLVGGGLLLNHLRSGTGDASGGLGVRAVTVRASPSTGSCPSARFIFTAAVTTNGASGHLVVAWRRPDGSSSRPTTVAVKSGQHSISAVLRFDVTGSKPLRGRAALHVISPTPSNSRSPAISYTC